MKVHGTICSGNLIFHYLFFNLKKLQEFDNKQLWLALHTYVSSLPRDSTETFRLTRQTSRLKSH